LTDPGVRPGLAIERKAADEDGEQAEESAQRDQNDSPRGQEGHHADGTLLGTVAEVVIPGALQKNVT